MATTKNSFDELKNLPETELGDDSVLVEDAKNNKRKELPSASSSDEGSPLYKKQFADNLNLADMSLKETVESMQKILVTLATKSDFDNLVGEIEKIRNEIGQFSRGINERIDKVEAKVFDIEQNLDRVIGENNSLREENEKLNQRIFEAERGLNDLEQYGRRVNLKVFNLKEDSNESTQDTTRKVCDMITNTIGITTTPEHIEACHRLPVSNEPRRDGKAKIKPIIIRFKSRQQRDKIFQNKAKCKGKGYSIGEDLTRENARRCQAAHNHHFCKSSWSVNGRIWAKLNNDKKIEVPFGTNIDNLFQSASQ